ncbi:MAG: hypothetical protein DRN15_00045 [Thermoprotei archaeon]|nr:MAG: hypothetical protein DRN15_00045 [Thermoprotei archaeon]
MDLEQLTIRALVSMIRETKGTCITVTPKKVALKAGLDAKPITLTVVRYVLDRLLELGWLRVWKTSRRIKYIITKESPLWTEAKSARNDDELNHRLTLMMEALRV